MNTIQLREGQYVVFGLDLTGSMHSADCPDSKTRIDYARERIAEAFETCAKAEPSWSADVVGFGTQLTPAPAVPLTAATVREHLKAMRADHGNTYTHEIVYFARRQLAERRMQGQGVLVIITDGLPWVQASTLAALDNATSDAEHALEVHMLTVGDHLDTDVHTWLHALSQQVRRLCVGRLERTEFVYARNGADERLVEATVRALEVAAPKSPSTAPPPPPPRSFGPKRKGGR